MTRLASSHVLLYHFTHISHVSAIVLEGLRSDVAMRADARSIVEAGDPAIKESRRSRSVPVEPGGVVGDYVPFYFAGRSPMLYKLTRGGVPGYTRNPHELVYLITSVENLRAHGRTFVVTDRNAAVRTASFHRDDEEWASIVDWDLMDARHWLNTPEESDRMERRMAECLVHETAPWDVFLGLAVASDEVAARLRGDPVMSGVDVKVRVERQLYY